MFLTPLKTLLVQAVRETFDTSYPVVEWQGLYCSIEYPEARAAYPSVWADFEVTEELNVVGVDSVFYQPQAGGDFQQVLGWRYQGHATYTVVALSSYERDRLFDELIKVLAFGRLNTKTSVFRQTVENNPFIAANMDFDQIQVRGMTAVPGTPWGSQEIIYEVTLAMEMVGEFYSDPASALLVPLSKIQVFPSAEAFVTPAT